jgi:hypothetical protein
VTPDAAAGVWGESDTGMDMQHCGICGHLLAGGENTCSRCNSVPRKPSLMPFIVVGVAVLLIALTFAFALGVL